METTPKTVETADGVRVGKGDRVFNYYDREVGTIVSEPDYEYWFDFEAETHKGDYTSRRMLNGERICSIEFAQKKGWL